MVPTKARTYVHDDCVIVLLREGHTKTEGSMFEGGARRAVAQGRVDLSEMIRDPLMEVIERNLGRRVAGFLSSSRQHPDLISFVFVLETSAAPEGRRRRRCRPRLSESADGVDGRLARPTS